MDDKIYLNEETEVSACNCDMLMGEDHNLQYSTVCSTCGNTILNDYKDISESYPPLDMMDVDYDCLESCPFSENQICGASNFSETCKCTLESCPIDCKCSLDWHNNNE